MKFIKHEFELSSTDTVEVSLTAQANVQLMDYLNFQCYLKGKSHKYYGGLVKVSPYSIKAPYAGHWYLTIDLGGYSGSIEASVRVFG